MESNLSDAADIRFAENQNLSPVIWKPVDSGVDWEALETARQKRFPPLPLDASDEQIARRSAEIMEWSQRPGRQVVIATARNAHGSQLRRERFIAHDDFARFSKPSSASLSTPPPAGRLQPPNRTSKTTAKSSVDGGSGSGSKTSAEKGSGSGYVLPELPNIQWELHKKGGYEAWHVPPGALHRKEKTYLGYVGKKQLSAWEHLEASRQAIIEWVAEKRAAKGITS